MEVNYGLEPDEVEAGFILTCQSHPRTEKVVVDFDVKWDAIYSNIYLLISIQEIWKKR